MVIAQTKKKKANDKKSLSHPLSWFIIITITNNPGPVAVTK